jgi:hypothetical protein
MEMPAPVVADALSYHPVTTAKIATQIGATWSRYAPGDHTRTRELVNTRAHQSGRPIIMPMASGVRCLACRAISIGCLG